MIAGTITKSFTLRGATSRESYGADSSWESKVDTFLAGNALTNGNVGKAYVTCLYGLDFTSIKNLKDVAFTDISVTIKAGRNGTSSTYASQSKLMFDMVADFPTGNTTNDISLSNMTRLTSSSITHTSGNVAVTSKTYTSSQLGNTLTWIKNNATKVLNSATQPTFGIRISDIYSRVESITVTLGYTYSPSIYVGNKLIKGLYLGATKVE